jgi:anti-anti-sigma factor
VLSTGWPGIPRPDRKHQLDGRLNVSTVTHPSVDPTDGTLPTFTAWLDQSGRPVLVGELDIGGVDALRTVLDQAMLEPEDVISIDASALTFVDSSGIREVLRYELMAAASGRSLWLESASPPVLQILDILDLRHILLSPGDRTPP